MPLSLSSLSLLSTTTSSLPHWHCPCPCHHPQHPPKPPPCPHPCHNDDNDMVINHYIVIIACSLSSTTSSSLSLPWQWWHGDRYMVVVTFSVSTWNYGIGWHRSKFQWPARSWVEACYMSQQTYVKVNDTYSEGGTHEEMLRPQSKAEVRTRDEGTGSQLRRVVDS